MMKALKKKRAKGFTLIELIVVIAILGILAAIAIPRFSQVSTNAQDTADQATARTILSAVSMAEAKYQPATPDAGQISEFLNDPIVVGTASATNEWAVRKDATSGNWIVSKYSGSAAKDITLP